LIALPLQMIRPANPDDPYLGGGGGGVTPPSSFAPVRRLAGEHSYVFGYDWIAD
jgi:hypothetical protein